VPHPIIWSWYTLAVDGWAVTFGTSRRDGAGATPRPLLTVPNVTAHPSTASVPITVLLCNCMLLCGFYRAMLCISAAIAVMRCPSVCLSVCLSVTFVDHVKTNKHIFEILSPSGSHTILVFPYQTGWRYSDGNPPNGGVKCRWGIGRNRDSGLIAGYRRLLDVRSAKNIYRRRSWVYDT